MTGRTNASGERGVGGRISVYSDGAARGNPGPAGIGGIARDDRGALVVEVSEYLGEVTNNVAEYHALIRVLEECEGRGYESVNVFTDSELVANQVAGGFKVKSRDLKPLNARVRALLEGYRLVQVEHIPREKNIECDRLANRAIDDGLAGRLKPVIKAYGEEQLFE
jgi:ribonuclease HI